MKLCWEFFFNEEYFFFCIKFWYDIKILKLVFILNIILVIYFGILFVELKYGIDKI